MEWDIMAECMAGVIVFIIFIYSKNGTFLNSSKNKIFQVCLFVTFLSILLNIVSAVFIYFVLNWPGLLFITNFITLLYFAVTPFMGAAYFLYIVAILNEDYLNNKYQIKKIIFTSLIPYFIYFILVLLNPWMKFFFYFDETLHYTKGNLSNVTYIIFFIYCIMSLFFILCNSKQIAPKVKSILASFPWISFLVIVLQTLFPRYVLTGSSACIALLIIYLYFQNKRLSMDYLTGILNRQEFVKMLRRKSVQNEPFSLFVISVRGFKFFNDKFGQNQGDILLKNLCDFLQSIGKRDMLYRYAGDQFALFVKPELEKQVQTLLLERLALPWKLDQSEYIVKCAVALVRYPDNAKTENDLLNCIEFTLAEAKEQRKTACVLCSEESLKQVKRKNEVIELLKDALEQETFEVYFQPIYHVKKEKFLISEALLRLNQTKIGAIYPDEFIPLAEQTGLIIEMTYFVLKKVCFFIRKLMDEKIPIEGVSVNFSVIQFMQEDLANKVIQIIEAYQIPFSKIKFEITESVLSSNFEQVKSFMKVMDQKGCLFGMDDFGTGYSNFSSVLGLPFHVIKLDKSMVWASVKEERSACFLEAITKTFHQLGIAVLAEGVETKEQDQFIKNIKCDWIQGYFYAKPMPEKDIFEFFKNGEKNGF